jgi:hypothetical protein
MLLENSVVLIRRELSFRNMYSRNHVCIIIVSWKFFSTAQLVLIVLIYFITLVNRYYRRQSLSWYATSLQTILLFHTVSHFKWHIITEPKLVKLARVTPSMKPYQCWSDIILLITQGSKIVRNIFVKISEIS